MLMLGVMGRSAQAQVPPAATPPAQPAAIVSAADAPALLTSPLGGSTLSGASVTFNWSTGTNATLYELNVSTYAGGVNIANVTTAGTSTLVTGLPTDGSTVYARLWTKYASTWVATPYTFTAANAAADAPALLTSPAGGSTLSGASVTFNWSAGTNATLYELNVGTYPGAVNVVSVQTASTSFLVTEIPLDGSTVYVRLWTKYASTWVATLYTFTAASPYADAPALLTSPANASTLTGASITFNWSAGTNATLYELNVSTYAGGVNIANVQTAGTSTLVTGIPTDGSTVYARLWTKYASTWVATPYTFTAATAAGGFTSISAGASHTCGLTAVGAVMCWGSNQAGQLGDGTTSSWRTPVNVSGLTSGVTAISTRSNHTCALTSAGGVKCWGYNIWGALGDGTRTTRLTPVDVSGLTSGVTAIAAGEYHTCALTSAGGVKCWGDNIFAALGDGTQTDRLTPVFASGLTSGASGISAGAYHTCAVTTVGGVKCWGANFGGQLGDASTTTRLAAVDVFGLTSGVAGVTAGTEHTCARTTTGGVKCWGDNYYGALGDGTTTTTRLTPVDVSGLTSGASAIAAGGFHTCAITSGGGVKCWGYNAFGQLGDGSTTKRLAPVDVSALTSGVASIAAGLVHTCARTTAGGLKCWGGDYSGELGDGSPTTRVPGDVSGLTAGATRIQAGGDDSCALTTAGAVKCWGDNSYGQLFDGTVAPRPVPTVVAGLGSGMAELPAGVGGFSITVDDHQCALTTAGGVKCWGHNSSGQLGDGTLTNRATGAIDVSGLTSGVTAIAVGPYHTCALTTAGGVKCWGYNAYGQLGDGTKTGRTTPVDVSGLTSGVAAIAVGTYHTCALTVAGGVRCWGDNYYGQLGNGTMPFRLTPVDVVTPASHVPGSAGDITAASGMAGGPALSGLGEGRLAPSAITAQLQAPRPMYPVPPGTADGEPRADSGSSRLIPPGGSGLASGVPGGVPGR